MRERKSTGPLGALGGYVAHGARAEAVFGAPVEHGGVLVIPVARARFGFGGGGGRGGRGEVGEGGGGGAVVRPVGFIELRRGRARFRRVMTPSDVAGIAVALAVVALAWRAVRSSPGSAPTRSPAQDASSERPPGDPLR